MSNENQAEQIGHQYVSAPKLVRAIRLEVDNTFGEYDSNLIRDFAGSDFLGINKAEVIVRTKTGRANAARGDWLIKTESGEVYPCSNADFVERYHRVSDSFQAHERSTAEEDQTPPSTKSWGGLVADVPTDGLIPGYHGYVKTNMSTESVTTAFLPLALVLRTLWRLYVWAKAGPSVPLDPHEAFVEGYQQGQADAHQAMGDFGLFNPDAQELPSEDDYRG